jgi:hypothetical protein
MPRAQDSPETDPDDPGTPQNAPWASIWDLNLYVQLVMGQLYYHDHQGNPQQCDFQFNPTEIERSRSVSYTRSRTGNVIEERHVGGRDRAKRKQTRKPDAWEMSLTLRFDAAYGAQAGMKSPPIKDESAKATKPPVNQATNPQATYDPMTASYQDELDRVARAMKFFELMAESAPFVSENEKTANADETPPPPYVTLALGKRMWLCSVKTVRIKEDDFTPMMETRRFEATLSLEVYETTVQNEQQKGPELTSR